MAIVAVACILIGVMGLVQWFFIPVSVGILRNSIYAYIAYSLGYNFLVIFSAMCLIYGLGLAYFVWRGKDCSEGMKVAVLVMVMTGICFLLSAI